MAAEPKEMTTRPMQNAPHTDTIRVRLTFPVRIVRDPIVYRLISEFQVVPNIRRANIDVNSGGYLFLELTGARENLDHAIAWLQSVGIGLDAIGLDGSEEWAI